MNRVVISAGSAHTNLEVKEKILLLEYSKLMLLNIYKFFVIFRSYSLALLVSADEHKQKCEKNNGRIFERGKETSEVFTLRVDHDFSFISLNAE